MPGWNEVGVDGGFHAGIGIVPVTGDPTDPGGTVPSIVQLYREARRRKVFRTALLYVLGSWAVLHAAAGYR